MPTSSRTPALTLPRRLLAAAGLSALTGLAVVGATSADAQGISPGIAPAPAAPVRDDGSELSADVFYRVILGEVAAQRGENSLAARAFFEAARESKDPRLARRATEFASRAGLRGLTQESARLWAVLDPTAESPKRIMASFAANPGGRASADPSYDSEIKARLEKAIAESALTPEGVGEVFMQINRLVGDALDKRQAYELVRDLAKPYPKSPEAHFAVALAAFNGAPEGQAERVAREEIDQALALKPDWERAIIVKSELIGRTKPDEAIALLEKFTADNPEARGAAGALGQFYVEQKRFIDGRAVLQRLWDKDRSQRELQYGIGVISMQMKDWQTAEAMFSDLKKANFGDNGVVELYLAQIAEEEGRFDEAIARYKAVPEGERNWLAKLRVAFIMGKMGKVGDARRYLADLPAVTIDQRVQVRQAEAQLLRDANDTEGAYAVLLQGVKEHPDNTDLLYDTAMVAEKLGKIDDAEARLRRVVELKPDDPQALNGLGYTLVDRTSRVAEGFALIERAHKLAPDDAFILDSMGWALFKLGRYGEAETYLRRAFKERPDAEIAAHLGEVLWAAGQRDRAQDVWQSQLKSTPDNPVLLETVRRLAR